MNFFKKLLTKNTPPPANQPLWEWFSEHERSFFHTVRSKDSQQINNRFLQEFMPRLQAIHDTLYCETGMFDETTAELVISAQGDVKSFVFSEDLVAAAPALAHWKFTALKPAMGMHDMGIHLGGYVFDRHKISFFYNDDPQYPDEIQLTFIHQDFTEANKDIVSQGVFLFLETVLGELDAATLIDKATVEGPITGGQQIIPMEKLLDFLTWKEKEFVEKYQGIRHQNENEGYSVLEGEDEEGFPSIGIVNIDLLGWDAKASLSWMLVIVIDYEKSGGVGNKGMPDDKHDQQMTRLEEELSQQLPDAAGYLSLGRQTYRGKRTLFLACKEYRNASRITHRLLQSYQPALSGSYEIYKDKYWRTMEVFRPADDAA
jgi:Family of unknown function (DUF695)